MCIFCSFVLCGVFSVVSVENSEIVMLLCCSEMGRNGGGLLVLCVGVVRVVGIFVVLNSVGCIVWMLCSSCCVVGLMVCRVSFCCMCWVR